jgi:L-lysine 2,3-aminomutase
VPGLVHRYPDRVLFLVTHFCSTNCRYCTRSRIVGAEQVQAGLKRRWQRAIEYIENTPRVRDVLLSGGDPLTLSDEKLEWLLSRLRRGNAKDRNQGTRSASPAYHPQSGARPQTLPPPLDEHPPDSP